MANIQHTFTHPCHHPAHGPILTPTLIYHPLTSHHTPLIPPQPVQKVTIPLFFPCPFCADPALLTTVKPGSGVLVILASTPGNPFPMWADMWRVVRVCRVEEVGCGEWMAGMWGGGWMAWVPRPGGEVILGGEEGGGGRDVVVVERWRGGMGENKEGWGWRGKVESRLPGMMAQLSATLNGGVREVL